LILIESKNDKYLEVPMYLDVIQHTFIDQTLEIALQFDIKPSSLLNQLCILCTSEKYKKSLRTIQSRQWQMFTIFCAYDSQIDSILSSAVLPEIAINLLNVLTNECGNVVLEKKLSKFNCTFLLENPKDLVIPIIKNYLR